MTIANGAPEPHADVRSLVDDLRGLAKVGMMATFDVSWAFSSQVPPQTQVHGSASRAKPTDHDWVPTPRTTPLPSARRA
ncbi:MULTISPECIES: hypothetical protein [unclassified Isoptericola]|uniref:hypothetical protein n=1 Tax=unclassified Isoptericola TaxID=2623355 RepID=UPI00366913B0